MSESLIFASISAALPILAALSANSRANRATGPSSFIAAAFLFDWPLGRRLRSGRRAARERAHLTAQLGKLTTELVEIALGWQSEQSGNRLAQLGLGLAELDTGLQQLALHLQEFIRALIADQLLIGDRAPRRKLLLPVLRALVLRSRRRRAVAFERSHPGPGRVGLVGCQLLAHLGPGEEGRHQLSVNVPDVGELRPLCQSLDGIAQFVAQPGPLL